MINLILGGTLYTFNFGLAEGTADELKKLEPKTPSVPSVRPTLKSHKVLLKIRLIIYTLVSRELKPFVLAEKSYNKDSASFVQTR